MKRVLSLVVALSLLLPNPAKAAGSHSVGDLVGLGMHPELADAIFSMSRQLNNNEYLTALNAAGSASLSLIKANASDDTVINSSASDDLILQLEDDASRLISFDAGSDAALRMIFGDAGTTATQILTVSASTADADDDSSLILAGGGAYAADGSRGASITLPGEEVAGGGDITYVAGASDTHVFSAGSTQTMSIGATGLVTAAAGFTATTGALTLTSGDAILNAQDTNLQVLSGASIDADVTTYAADGSSVAYVGSNSAGSLLNVVANIADANGAFINLMKTRAAANSWDANTIVAANDDLGAITAVGADGAAYQNAARILFESDTTPGAGDMPGRIVFQTTPDGSATLTTAMTINNAQTVQVAGSFEGTSTGSLGWSYVDGTDNTACTAQCTFAAVFGVNLAAGATAPVLVGPADATADACICAGAS